MLKPQDSLVLLKIQSIRSMDAHGATEDLLKYSELGASIGISPSQVHQSVKRLIEASLLRKGMIVRPNATAEWLTHGVKYFLPAKFGGLTRGMATSYAAPPLSVQFGETSQEPVPVWELAEGVRGIALEPIYKTAPLAAKHDPNLYEYLTLVDAIRVGRVREVGLATELLQRKLGIG